MSPSAAAPVPAATAATAAVVSASAAPANASVLSSHAVSDQVKSSCSVSEKRDPVVITSPGPATFGLVPFDINSEVDISAARQRHLRLNAVKENECLQAVQSESDALREEISALWSRRNGDFQINLIDSEKLYLLSQQNYEELQRDFLETLDDTTHPLTSEEESQIAALIDDSRFEFYRARARFEAFSSAQKQKELDLSGAAFPVDGQISSAQSTTFDVPDSLPRSKHLNSASPDFVQQQLAAKRKSLKVSSAYEIEAERAKVVADRMYQQQSSVKQQTMSELSKLEARRAQGQLLNEQLVLNRKSLIIETEARLQFENALNYRHQVSEIDQPVFPVSTQQFDLSSLALPSVDVSSQLSTRVSVAQNFDFELMHSTHVTSATPPDMDHDDLEFLSTPFSCRVSVPPASKQHRRFAIESERLQRETEIGNQLWDGL
jgi:hypothetical protein